VIGKPILLVGSGTDCLASLPFVLKLSLDTFDVRDIRDLGRAVLFRSVVGSSVVDTTKSSRGIGFRYTLSCSFLFVPFAFTMRMA
jgi:hypothetical protein